eukprot:4914762-Pleurochrysis_carterae.AAC.4
MRRDLEGKAGVVGGWGEYSPGVRRTEIERCSCSPAKRRQGLKPFGTGAPCIHTSALHSGPLQATFNVEGRTQGDPSPLDATRGACRNTMSENGLWKFFRRFRCACAASLHCSSPAISVCVLQQSRNVLLMQNLLRQGRSRLPEPAWAWRQAIKERRGASDFPRQRGGSIAICVDPRDNSRRAHAVVPESDSAVQRQQSEPSAPFVPRRELPPSHGHAPLPLFRQQ